MFDCGYLAVCTVCYLGWKSVQEQSCARTIFFSVETHRVFSASLDYGTKSHLERLQEGQAALRKGQAALAEGQSALAANVAELKAEIKTTMEQMV